MPKQSDLGDKATPVLEEYLQAKEYFQQLLAIRLLDEIGTDTSRDVLGEFAEKADNAATRSYALDFLMYTGREKDISLVEKIAITDSDIDVRTRAVDLLQKYRLEHESQFWKRKMKCGILGSEHWFPWEDTWILKTRPTVVRRWSSVNLTKELRWSYGIFTMDLRWVAAGHFGFPHAV
jgi:hypothetical protein